RACLDHRRGGRWAVPRGRSRRGRGRRSARPPPPPRRRRRRRRRAHDRRGFCSARVAYVVRWGSAHTEGGAVARSSRTSSGNGSRGGGAGPGDPPPGPAGAAGTGRTPPHDLEAEKAVLSALLIDNAAIHSVLNEVAPDDFYHPSHQSIYKAMLALQDEN